MLFRSRDVHYAVQLTCRKCVAGVGEELVLVLELSVVLGAEALAVAGW